MFGSRLVAMSDLTRLSASDAAARLGIKPQTLYAYVSRGMLTRHRDGHGSTFDPLEIEHFAQARQKPAGDRPAPVVTNGRAHGTPLMTIDTDVALIEDDQLYLRGEPASELARHWSFEMTCHWLWTGQHDASVTFTPRSDLVVRMRPLSGAVDEQVLFIDRLKALVSVAGSLDPLRDDLDPASIAERMAGMFGLLAAILPRRRAGSPVDDRRADPQDGSDHGFAAALWQKLSPQPPTPDRLRQLSAALVLLVDHDLAVSTVAARAAASARAHPYAVLVSGLGALDSPLHGQAGAAAFRMLAEVADGTEPERVIAETLVAQRGGIPGFGHRIYQTRDPRAEVIIDLLRDLPQARRVLDAVDRLSSLVSARTGSFRNADLALAALALVHDMSIEAPETIFALARMGGWVAHALDEYGQAPLRFRPIGRYVGP